MLQAFHNEKEVKDKYVNRVIAHRKADNIIQGTGWEEGKGCAVGCTLERYTHESYPIELGIPEWLAHLEDTLFEGMEQKDAMVWPENFLKAIPLGVTEGQFDKNVKRPFMIFILEGLFHNFDIEEYPEIAAVIKDVIALHKRGDVTNDEWRSARSAAASAAASASAASAASASAASAASASSWSASASAASAASAVSITARTEAYKQYADKLIELLEQARG